MALYWGCERVWGCSGCLGGGRRGESGSKTAFWKMCEWWDWCLKLGFDMKWSVLVGKKIASPIIDMT